MARTALMAWLLTGVVALSVGCGLPQTAIRTAASQAVTAKGEWPVQFLAPSAIPPSVLASLQGGAQKTADDASRRKDIDFFNLHANPVGLRIGTGARAAHVLSFLGTSRDRTDLNIELRALSASGKTAYVFNYSGPVTLSAVPEVFRPTALRARSNELAFELLTGLPGGQVTEAYGDFLERLGTYLQRRYQARPFTFDDTPLVFVLQEGDEPVGFLFTNQRNHLVLGDRKYADVQSVAFVAPDGEVLGAYTLIGFNAKTVSPGAAPTYVIEQDERHGTLVQFGEL